MLSLWSQAFLTIINTVGNRMQLVFKHGFHIDVKKCVSLTWLNSNENKAAGNSFYLFQKWNLFSKGLECQASFTFCTLRTLILLKGNEMTEISVVFV